MSAPGTVTQAQQSHADPAMRPLMLIGAFLFTSAIGCRVTTALAALHAGLSPALIGPMIGLFALMPMVFGMHGGKLIDRIGVRRPLVGGALCAAVGAAVCAALPHPLVLAGMAVVIGTAHMAFSLAMQQVAGELGGPTRRTANFNLLTMSFSLSGLMGPTLVGLLIDRFGHRAAFACMATMAACVMFAVSRVRFDRLLPAPHGVSATGPSATTVPRTAASTPRARSGWRSAFDLTRDRRFRDLLLASLVVAAAWDAFQFLIPLHGHDIGLSAASVGLGIASFSAGSLTIRLLMPHLSRRLSPRQWLLLALGGCIAGYAMLPFSAALPPLMLMCFVLGMGPGIGLPLVMASLHTAAPAGRAGEAAGLRVQLQSAQQIALPVLLGVLAALVGVKPMFWLYALVALTVTLAIRPSLSR